MPRIERTAEAVWQGRSASGSGTIAGRSSGAFELRYSEPTRVGDPAGQTSPEELIAAAHAACFAMALSGTLGRKSARVRMLHVTATITAEFGETGLKIQSSKLQAVAEGLEGIPSTQFAEVAKEAEGRCPVSNALRGSLKIELDARTK